MYTAVHFPVTEHALPQLFCNRSDMTTFSCYTRSFSTGLLMWNLINTFHGQTEMIWRHLSQTTAKKIKNTWKTIWEKWNTKQMIYWKHNVTLMAKLFTATETIHEKLKRKQSDFSSFVEFLCNCDVVILILYLGSVT